MITKFLLALRLRLWHAAPQQRLTRWTLQALQMAYALLSVLTEGRLSLWAMSLVYTTLLSLTPFLALGFSLLKALGVHNSLEPVLIEALKALGPTQAQQVADTVIRFVANVKVGVLGSLGVSLLLYSAISLIRKVESAFNEVWLVERPRALSQRLPEYLAVLLVGPVIVFSALGLTAGALNNSWVVWMTTLPPLGFLIHSLATLLPYLLMVGMFTFLYGFIPNARVRPGAAFMGGVVAGLLWQTASFVFAGFVARATNYNAIYSGFAIVIFVLIWLYVGWLILLSGCQIAYFSQHPERMNPFLPPPDLAGRAREQVGLMVMTWVTLRFLRGEPPARRDALARQLGLAEAELQQLAVPLIAAGYLAESGESWLPARDPSGFTMGDLWRQLRGGAPALGGEATGAVAGWLDQAEACVVEVDHRPFRDWVLSLSAAAGEKTAISQ